MVRKEYLLLMDGDSCVMATEKQSYEECFCSAMTEIWDLEYKKEELWQCWSSVDLTVETSECNRFLVLCKVLGEKGNAFDLDGYAELKDWTRHAEILSSESLRQWIEQYDTDCCRKAYEWSLLVDQKINRISQEEKHVYPGVMESLKQVAEETDIAVIFSREKGDVKAVWEREGLLPYTNSFMTCGNGGKSNCVRILLERGYKQEHVLIAGGTPKDWNVVKGSEISFYPITPGEEQKSWDNLKGYFFKTLLKGKVEEE